MPRIGRSRRRSTPKRSIWDCRPARPRWYGARRRSRRNGAVTDFAHIRIARHEGGIAAVVVERADIGNATTPAKLGETRDALSTQSAAPDATAPRFSTEARNYKAAHGFTFYRGATWLGGRRTE